MKKIFGILLLLGLVFFGALIYGARNIDSIISDYKPQILDLAKNAVGGDIVLGEVETSIFPETAITISKVGVNGSSLVPNTSVDLISLKLSLISLLKGNLNIHEIALARPKLEIPASKPQSENIPAKTNNQNTKSNSITNSSAQNSSPLNIPIGLNLQSFSITDAEISIPASNLKVSEVHLNTQASFENSLAALENLRIKGKINSENFDVNSGKISFDVSKGSASINKLVSNLSGIITEINTELDSKNLSGNGTLNINANNLNGLYAILKSMNPSFIEPPTVVTNLNVPISFKINNANAEISSDSIKTLLNDIPVEVKFNCAVNKNSFKLFKLELNGFDGPLFAKLNFGLSDKKFNSEYNTKAFSTEKAARAFVGDKLPVKIYGNLDSLDGSTEGKADENLMKSINGNTSFQLSKGGLKGINILGPILDALQNIPVIGSGLRSKMTKEVMDVASSPDTQFDSLTGSVSFKSGLANLNNITLKSALLNVSSNGTFDLSTASMNVSATAVLNPPLVNNLVLAGKDFEKIKNPDGTITIPVIIKKDSSGMQILPDIEKLSKSIAGKVLKDQAKKAIGKLFGF
jgi:hypothetical protein